MKNIILTTFAIVGLVVPYTVLGLFIFQNGLNIPLLLSQVFATYSSTFFAIDVIICALLAIALSISNKSLGNKRYYVIAAAALVGPSCALPLYLRLKDSDI